MELPCIILCTKEKGHFPWQSGYTDVGDSDLETFAKISKELVFSLEAELKARQLVVKSDMPSAVLECAEKLSKSAKNIKILERLGGKEAKLVASAVDALKAEQTSRDGKLYQAFLNDIYQCSRSLVVLCAASLGRQRVISMNSKERIALVQYFKSNQEALNSPGLDSIAKTQIPEKSELFLSAPQSLKRKSSDAAEGYTQDDTTLQKRLQIEPTNILPSVIEKANEDDRGSLRGPDDASLASQPPGVVKPIHHTVAIPLERQIEYRYSETPIDTIDRLAELLPPAIRSSKQWMWERGYRESTTDCLNILIPKNWGQDISITVLVGFREGSQLVRDLSLKKS